MDITPYVIIGAGAIGGSVAGLLHRAGRDITLVARGANLDTLNADGLQLRVGHDEYRLRVPAVGGLSEIDWSRSPIVMLAVKSQQTDAVLAELAPILPPDSPLVSLQNGVSNERAMLRMAGLVYAVSVFMPATYLRPGEVFVHSAGMPGILDIGRYPGGVDEIARAMAADFDAAGFDSVARADLMAWKYRKLVHNLGNAIDATFAQDEDAQALGLRARDEGERVLAAAGIALISTGEDIARRGDKLQPLIGRDTAGSSTWQSVARGTGDVEVDYLNGEIVLLGRLHGVPTPVNEALRRTCVQLARAGGQPRSLRAAKLLAAIDAG